MISSSPAVDAGRHARMRPALGTFVSIAVPRDGLAAGAVAAAFAEIDTIEREMSFHDPASALSRVNRDAAVAAQSMPPRLARVLSAALALAAASDGAFDPTVGAAMVRSGHLPAPAPRPPEIGTSWRDVLLTNCTVQFRRPLWLDLGGIAKGYAVDRAVAVLRRCGVASGFVNAGGDLRVFGSSATIRVRDPLNPTSARSTLQLRDGAVATSGGYFSDVDGASAIVVGAGDRRLPRHGSVTVVAPRAIWADGLTKVALAMPDGPCRFRLFERLQAEAIDDRLEARRRTA